MRDALYRDLRQHPVRLGPGGAEIIIDGLVVGRTPTTVSVKRPGLSDQLVTLRLDGYDSVTFALSDEFNAVSILNLAGLRGWGVDIWTGAVTKYDKQAYDVDMDRGTVALRLGDLERTEEGAYVLPEAPDGVTVVDEQAGLQFVFGTDGDR